MMVRRVLQAIRSNQRLSPLRRRAMRALTSPSEYPTLFPLEWAEYYPHFRRGHDHEDEASADMRRVAGYTMTKYDRCAVLHNLVRYVEESGLHGSLVECGVWRGGSAGVMALANLRYGQNRRVLHLFDAWGDWPDPTPRDGNCFDELKAGVLLKADNTAALEATRQLLEDRIRYPADHLYYHRGLLDDTIPRADVGPIAVLRLDADWYEGTRMCLAQLGPLVVSGGIVVIDDYGYSDGARRATDEWMAAEGNRGPLHFVDYSCRYLVL